MAEKLQQTSSDKELSKAEIVASRAEIFRNIREYFYKEDVIEVDTPIMSQFGNPDPALLNFVSQFNGPGALYKAETFLITSPEYHMKRLLAEGVGSCYYLGKVFRDGELSPRHNPEFTMLEWYRVAYDLAQLMDEVVKLIQYLVEEPLEVEYFTYRDAFKTILGIDPFLLDLPELEAFIAKSGIEITFDFRTKDEALDLIVSHLIEPAFDPDKITLLSEYPASQASLSQIVEKDGVYIGKRFEAYWQGLELANGYEELTQSCEQKARFMIENEERQLFGMKPVPIDTLLLEVLNDLPFCSGVALGVDRLLMAKKRITDINQVIPFGFESA